MEKQLNPNIEKEIKEGFFEIKKKFGAENGSMTEEVQVYVSHLCLRNYHPIFCKFDLDAVKIFLSFSQIVYLNKGQILFDQGYNENQLYVILFGKLRLSDSQNQQIGQTLNIGWTAGEEILFKQVRRDEKGNERKIVTKRGDRCTATVDSCVLGFEKKSLRLIKL